MHSQYIVICLRDSTPEHPKTYVQPTRRRFLTTCQAIHYKNGIAPSRQPVVVEVPAVKLNYKNYPVYP